MCMDGGMFLNIFFLLLGLHVTCQIQEIAMSLVTKRNTGLSHVAKVPKLHVDFKKCPSHCIEFKK